MPPRPFGLPGRTDSEFARFRLGKLVCRKALFFGVFQLWHCP
ncbi:hypothetical protein NEIELOOT_03058 [Neisseria elongata subsp. glycolytica ATCC 29315]|uniref:Uncharacterized protein n=1 Tax=Neisseria elongata subsp. glycolytica ATCC 29315 TaxID=546263 RepID=D4DVE1_NEIEG|nr:hypothetical protein NEIELOOT_03058 [Neisseria elongata subsp. glycolytica ATCC 29315]